MKSKPYGGSGWGKHKKGVRVIVPSQVHKGQILLDESVQFHARNVAKVTKTFKPDDRIYCRFVDPDNVRWPRHPADDDFCVWDFEMTMPGLRRLYTIKE
jgi:hypothetical protein